MKSSFHLAVAFSITLFGASESFACSCADPSVREKFRAADSVFIGSVIEMTPVSPTGDFPLAANMVKFKVEKRWKGSGRPEVTALADYDQPGWCGDLNLRVGERYLIYAARKKGRLIVHTDCGPNLEIKYAKEEVKRLNGFWYRFFARIYPYPAV